MNQSGRKEKGSSSGSGKDVVEHDLEDSPIEGIDVTIHFLVVLETIILELRILMIESINIIY